MHTKCVVICGPLEIRQSFVIGFALVVVHVFVVVVVVGCIWQARQRKWL